MKHQINESERHFNELIFKMGDDEEKGKIKINPDLNKQYGTISTLKVLPFWFSLGLDQNKNISFGGNCYKWSNAFDTNPKRFKLAFDIIKYHNQITAKQEARISKLLREYPNKLFFCKSDKNIWVEREKETDINNKPIIPEALYFHFYPEEDYKHCIIIKYVDCSELEGVLK